MVPDEANPNDQDPPVTVAKPPPRAESTGTVGEWARRHPGAILGVISGLAGSIFVLGQVFGAMMIPANVEAVNQEVESLSARVETLEGLSDRVETLQGLSDRVETLQGLSNRVETLEGLSAGAQSATAPARAEPLLWPVNNAVDGLRAQVRVLLEAAGTELDILRTEVDRLSETPMTWRHRADVAGLRQLVVRLGTTWTVQSSTTLGGQIDGLNEQAETLQAIIECSIIQTENVRQFLLAAADPNALPLDSAESTAVVESCGALLELLGGPPRRR